ncbi:hypothetical protein BGZ65_001336 [Modicella reniformis]|uniref:Uncharacterized protein n=1 Tax=Modicella reniformis TaxID=1440133 RepID=A0A9P6MJN4_9FUNG|nr:hypothetical protein BGZ65_001336 [Modicella reniformis]
MATYKQRTPYQRHTATYSDDEYPQATGTTYKQTSNAPSIQLSSQHLHHSNNNHQTTDDDLLESISNREWTSFRNNSSASARARARLQQYLDQQEQRTREWQFVLAQHHHTASSRDVSDDEYDDVLSGTDMPSIVTNPGATNPTAEVTGTTCGDEHSSFLGLSDMASDGVEKFRFQNQMPFHDGSGNFFTARSVRSNIESDIDESERGWESSSSRASSLLRSYRSTMGQRPEFKAVIQNIAEQHAGGSTNSLRYPSMKQCSTSQSRGVDSNYSVQSSDPQPRFTYPSVVTRRPIFNIYESEMEDMADMMEVPSKVGWLQTFEQVLRVLQPNEYNIRVSDSTMLNPIKALAHHLRPEDSTETRESASTLEDAVSNDDALRGSVEPVHNNSMTLQQAKQNMASASLETMQRLQTRKRSDPQRHFPSDPMQVEFSPTVRSRSVLDETHHHQHRRERRTTSRSTGTSTSSNHSSKDLRESNLIAVVLSTLRRFRDHVQSNLLHADFNDEEDRHADLARSLGFDGGLGIEWSRTVPAAVLTKTELELELEIKIEIDIDPVIETRGHPVARLLPAGHPRNRICAELTATVD